jgi:hypothetical protein
MWLTRFSYCSCCTFQVTKFGKQVSACSCHTSDLGAQIEQQAVMSDATSDANIMDNFANDHSDDVQITDEITDELEHDGSYSPINEVSTITKSTIRYISCKRVASSCC